MKTLYYRLPIIAIAAAGLTAVLAASPLIQVMYDGARTGGAAWAGATVSLGDLGQLMLSATH